jgi:hypothetical protein
MKWVTDDTRVDTAEVVSDGTYTSTAEDIKDAVDKKHTGSHSGTISYIPKFSGTNTLVDSLATETSIVYKHLRLTILDPNTAVDTDICLIPSLDAAITVTKIVVTCNADPATEIAGDLKYADAFIGMANAAVINDFDTTNGVRVDSSISNGNVASGKCVYLAFDATPEAAILQICFDITYKYQ